ncbi:hypothetical protein V2J09_016487 [Rumex salicifolius]
MWEELWMKKCHDESEIVNWITVNTKPSPKCHKPTIWLCGFVAKHFGEFINPAICDSSYVDIFLLIYLYISFCLCGGATRKEHTWSKIANYSCGRYKEDKKRKPLQRKNSGVTFTITLGTMPILILLSLQRVNQWTEQAI